MQIIILCASLGFALALPTPLDRVGRARGFSKDGSDNRVVNGEVSCRSRQYYNNTI